jgi:RNA polymerase sigma-70 factor (ECF subfamily)
VNAAMSSWPARMGVRTSGRPSFAAIAEEHLDAVYRYLLLMTRDRAVAEDLTGDTFEKAFRSWRRFDPRRASPRTWLCHIARNAALDHFRSEERRHRRETSWAVDVPETEEHAVGGLSEPFEAALGELSAGEREVVALRVLLELDGRAAARVLGISPTACSTRLSRALQKLEEKVRDHGR